LHSLAVTGVQPCALPVRPATADAPAPRRTPLGGDVWRYLGPRRQTARPLRHPQQPGPPPLLFVHHRQLESGLPRPRDDPLRLLPQDPPQDRPPPPLPPPPPPPEHRQQHPPQDAACHDIG